MGERKKIVAWLRRRAREAHEQATAAADEDGQAFLVEKSVRLRETASAIERGDHLAAVPMTGEGE